MWRKKQRKEEKKGGKRPILVYNNMKSRRWSWLELLRLRGVHELSAHLSNNTDHTQELQPINFFAPFNSR